MSAKEFSISSPIVINVPKQTTASNVQDFQSVQQASSQPYKQIQIRDFMNSGGNSGSFTPERNFFITKIICTFDLSAKADLTIARVIGGSFSPTIFKANAPTGQSTINFDFNYPYLFDILQGKGILFWQVNGLGSGETADIAIFGFETPS